jgi:hypothetical protein
VMVPTFRSLLLDELPETSPGSGQLIVFIDDVPDWTRDGGATGYASNATVQPFSFIAPRILNDPTRLLYVIVHEIAHNWQFAWRWHQGARYWRDRGATSTQWAEEGGAEYMTYDVLRRRDGLEFDGDYQSWNSFTCAAICGSGEINRGYTQTTGLLAYLMWQRMRAGESHDEAARTVLRGAMEGWYGYDLRGHDLPPRPGLVGAMRAMFGPEWDPATAMLMWRLAHAADDETSNPELQIPFHRSAGRSLAPAGSGIFGSGWAASARRLHGSVGHVLMRDAGTGGVFEASADVAGVEWMIVRLR